MPYETTTGTFERASRTGHANAVVRAMADKAAFFVPAEKVPDAEWLRPKVRTRASLALDHEDGGLEAALAIDGSRTVVPVRDGIPSVRYGYAQAAAAYLDLAAMESQRGEKFVDPAVLARAVTSALVSLDLPVAGAYTRERISIHQSWRESLARIFASKRVEVNRLDQSLLDLLFLLHGTPGNPAKAVPVNCAETGCTGQDIPVGPGGAACPVCGAQMYATDTLRIHEEVVEDGSNEEPLGRLMQVVELLVLVGLTTLLWTQARHDLLVSTLFIMDGPLAVYGPPAKLRARALTYFQTMRTESPGGAPHVCGIEKSGLLVDYARSLAKHDVLHRGELLVVDADVIAVVTNSNNPAAYGSETYWGRKFVYRALDGRVVVPTILPEHGAPYDDHGGQPEPSSYPSISAILDVIDRTGSSMYIDGIIPVALAHGKAAYPIGVGTDVLRLVARRKLGIDG